MNGVQNRGSKRENLQGLGITAHFCSEPRDQYLMRMVLVPQLIFNF